MDLGWPGGLLRALFLWRRQKRDISGRPPTGRGPSVPGSGLDLARGSFSLQGLNMESQFPGQGLDGGGESAKKP